MAADQDEMLRDCLEVKDVPKKNGGPGYTEWELEFLDSIEDQVGEGRRLSAKQLEVLERMYDRI